MGDKQKAKSGRSKGRSRVVTSTQVFKSYLEWKEKTFPEQLKKDKFEKLRTDTEKLATILADDTFNRVMLGNRD